MGEAATDLSYSGRVHPDYRPPVSHLMKPPFVVGPDAIDVAKMTEEMRLRANALKEVWVRQARSHFPSFMQYCFYDYDVGRPFEQQWFHDDWSKAMDTISRLLIVAPRNHGKTSQVIGRTIWELGRNHNLRIKIACASDGRAKERLFEITQNILYNPRVKEVFPTLLPDENAQWNVHKIHVQRTALHKDASVEAVGITSTATGGRCDLLIPDDVVDRRNALSFPALRAQIKQAWLSDWTNLLNPDSRVWGICTLWHKDDLNHMLMDNPAYTTLFYAVPQNFGSLWVGKWPEEALRTRHAEIGSVEFNRGFRNQAIDTESQVINPDWLIYRDLTEDEEFQCRVDQMFFFNSYDTATAPTGNKEQDFSASVTIAVDVDAAKIYVIDAWHARRSLQKMSTSVWNEANKYHPFRIVIEKVGQSSLHEWVLNNHPQLEQIIETATPKISKTLRLLGCTPLFERGQIIFSKHLDPNQPTWDIGRGSIIHELEDFPFAKHDDLVDALSQAIYSARYHLLDVWASGGDNGQVDIRIGSLGNDSDATPYKY